MKFEFGDLYKFIVSLGVILITLSILGPWLFLREPFDLQIKKSDLQELTVIAQETIEKRQEFVLIATKIWPWLSPVFALFGISLIVLGIRSWRKNQDAIDQQMHAESDLALHNLRSATEKERQENIEAEAAESVAEEGKNTKLAKENSKVSIVFDIEQAVVKKLLAATKKHDVITDQVVDNSYFDVILKSNSRDLKDYVIEIKYVDVRFSYKWVRETACNVRQLGTTYARVVNRLPNTALLIILSNRSWDEGYVNELLDKLTKDLRHRGGKHAVVAVSMKALENLEPTEFAEMLQLKL